MHLWKQIQQSNFYSAYRRIRYIPIYHLLIGEYNTQKGETK
nr:MAG TPA: hypothetical protein [Caudoviricetes sp.]